MSAKPPLVVWVGCDPRHGPKAWQSELPRLLENWLSNVYSGLRIDVESAEFLSLALEALEALTNATELSGGQVVLRVPVECARDAAAWRKRGTRRKACGEAVIGVDVNTYQPALGLFDELSVAIAPWAIAELDGFIRNWCPPSPQVLRVGADPQFSWDLTRLRYLAGELTHVFAERLAGQCGPPWARLEPIDSMAEGRIPPRLVDSWAISAEGAIYWPASAPQISEAESFRVGSVFSPPTKPHSVPLASPCRSCLFQVHCGAAGAASIVRQTGALGPPSAISCRLSQAEIFSALGALEARMSHDESVKVLLDAQGNLYTFHGGVLAPLAGKLNHLQMTEEPRPIGPSAAPGADLLFENVPVVIRDSERARRA